MAGAAQLLNDLSRSEPLPSAIRLCITMIHEKSKEWNVPVWFAAVDFKKAFDTVNHKYLWLALADAGVPAPLRDPQRAATALPPPKP